MIVNHDATRRTSAMIRDETENESAFETRIEVEI